MLLGLQFGIPNTPEGLSMSALPFGRLPVSGTSFGCRWLFGTLASSCLKFLGQTFSTTTRSITAEQDVWSCQSAVFLFFQLLGWTVAKDGDKSVPFSQVFHALGVVFDVSRTPDITESRRLEVRNWCQQVLPSGCVSPQQCSSFASGVRWLDGQTHGRQGRIALRVLLDDS